MSGGTLLALMFGAILLIFVYSMQRFKNQMLCTFIRPNKQKIEKWVPLYSTYIIFDRGKYGIGQYNVDPNCITMMWYDRGIHKLFPTLVPTLEFKWDTPNPLNPNSFQSTWSSPEVIRAAWQGHDYQKFAQGAAAQAGKKSRFPEWFFPAITIALCLLTLFLIWQLGGRIDALEQLFKLK